MQVGTLSPTHVPTVREKRPLNEPTGPPPRRAPAPAPPPCPSAPRIGDEAGRYVDPAEPGLYHRAECAGVHAVEAGADALRILASPFRPGLLRLEGWAQAEAAGLRACPACAASPGLQSRAAWEGPCDEPLYCPSRGPDEERARRDAALRFALLSEGGDDPFAGDLF